MKHCDNIDKDEENIPLVIETDASDMGIAAALGQASCPVAFFTQSLMPTEWKYTSVENEASAIIKAEKGGLTTYLVNISQLWCDPPQK